jgi:hypothetical protein
MISWNGKTTNNRAWSLPGKTAVIMCAIRGRHV